MTRGPERAIRRTDVLDAFESQTIYTTAGATREFMVGKDTVYDRLRELAHLDKIQTKQTGGRSRVWWLDSRQSIDDSFIGEMSFRSNKDPRILDALVTFGERCEPTTSGELATILDERQDSVYTRLRHLDDTGLVKSAKVGGNSVVWWLATAGLTAQT